MDRRRGLSGVRPSNEEVECWSHASESLSVLSSLYGSAGTTETIGRVNRLLSAWPPDDTLPAEGIAHMKTIQQKLTSGLSDIMNACDQEIKAIDDVLERVSVLMALRRAPPEVLSGEKRNKRPRGSSPGTPMPLASGNARSVSITVPPRTNSVGPTGISRDSRNKKDSFLKSPILQPGRKVAFRPPPSTQSSQEESTWIMAIITKYLSSDKHGPKYEVQDAEPQDDGQPGATYIANSKSLVPLPEQDASPGSPGHISTYPEFPIGSFVLALYPDTSCFYRAEVIATRAIDRSSPSKAPMYKVKFEDDEDMEHTISAYWVVENPR